jgi:hypothetical protein
MEKNRQSTTTTKSLCEKKVLGKSLEIMKWQEVKGGVGGEEGLVTNMHLCTTIHCKPILSHHWMTDNLTFHHGNVSYPPSYFPLTLFE